NITELSVPLYSGPGRTVPGACGQLRQGMELRLVDENDQPVAHGAVDERIVRSVVPRTLSHGSLDDPGTSAATCHHARFHTGDLFRRDGDDNYFHVDRDRDVIRRRGQNISSCEVEAELLAYPGVRAAAAVPVAGDGGEDEVLA